MGIFTPFYGKLLYENRITNTGRGTVSTTGVRLFAWGGAGSYCVTFYNFSSQKGCEITYRIYKQDTTPGWGKAYKEAKLQPWLNDLYHLHVSGKITQEEYDKAENEFKTALKLEKECAPAYAGLGIILVNKGDVDGAQKKFEMSIETDPEYDDAHYRLGTIYMEKKEYDKAESSLRAAIRLNPRNANAFYILARRLAMNDGTVSEAISMFNRAISMMPLNMQVYTDLGNLYLKSGDKARAINIFERALKVNPNAQNVRTFLSRLKQQR